MKYLKKANTGRDWVFNNKEKILSLYQYSDLSVKKVYEHFVQECEEIKERQIREVLNKVEKLTPRHRAVKAAYEYSVSYRGIEESHLYQIMEECYGTKKLRLKGKWVEIPNYTSEDYFQVTNNLRAKASREGKKCRIVPDFMYGLSSDVYEELIEAFPKCLEYVKEFSEKTLSTLPKESIDSPRKTFKTQKKLFDAFLGKGNALGFKSGDAVLNETMTLMYELKDLAKQEEQNLINQRDTIDISKT